MVTSMLVIHFGFLKPSLVAVRNRSGKPNGSVIGSRAYLITKIIYKYNTITISILPI